MFANARSIKTVSPDRPKLRLLNVSLLSEEYDVYAVCETWAGPSLTDYMITAGSRYNVHRCDRKKGRGGGVLFLVSTRLCSTPIPTPVHLEIVCVEIKGERESLRLINWYRSPNSSLDYLLESCRCIEGLFETQSECILFSDANFPGISWEKGVSKTAKGRVFLDLCSSLGLDQLVDSPTRGRNILDLVLCQNPCCVASLKVGDPFLLSDHNSV